jgi:four helix bundle protein
LSDKIESYRDLKVWQSAMSLAEGCYTHTKTFPREEMFGLTSQIRRAAVSIAANIAEGYGRDQTGSYVQFLKTAQGSLKELETHLILAERVGVSDAGHAEPLLNQCQELGRMLRRLIRTLQEG